MAKFPVDAPKKRVIRAFELLGFYLVLKSGTLRAICTQIGVSREEFIKSYNQS